MDIREEKRNLEKEQKKLRLTFINYNLNDSWQSHNLIKELRNKIIPLLPKGLYDPQDLEHQILFRLTTYDPKEINNEIIKEVINEQKTIIENRLRKIKFDIKYLFRGLTNNYKDLNCKKRLTIKKDGEKLFAIGDGISLEVEFKKVENIEEVLLFSSDFHYIHQNKNKGDAFGLYFKGDEIPFAIETTEPSVISKDYKRESLLAHGIDPNKAIELTRFYALPGSPLNSISIMDKCISKYYKKKGIEALFTTTMPMYSKTKGATIGGGLNKVLLVKELSHKFVPIYINGKKYYKHVTSDYIEKNNIKDYIITHPNFPTLFTVEVFKLINKPSLKPLEILKEKVIYVNRNKKIEKEIKFAIKDIPSIIREIRKIAELEEILYVRDSIYGCKDKKKIRLRIQDNFRKQTIEAVSKYLINTNGNTITAGEEIIYRGEDIDSALKEIRLKGNFKKENSYEKIRAVYKSGDSKIFVDIYPYGAFIEIEGQIEEIWQIAEKIGYKKEDAILLNADEIYLQWNKEKGLKELWDVRFGLPEDT